MKIFDDKELQERFDKAKDMYEVYRLVVSKKVDFTNPVDVLKQLGDINNVASIGAECEAMFEFLNDKNAMKKLTVLDMDSRGSAEKKIILNNEIGGTNFWLTLIRLLVKEAHHSTSRLITALNYLKQDVVLL